MIVIILFIGGIQLLCLSIIGSYMAHMYEEVKGRPSFVVESVINPPARRRDSPGSLGRDGAHGSAVRPRDPTHVVGLNP